MISSLLKQSCDWNFRRKAEDMSHPIQGDRKLGLEKTSPLTQILWSRQESAKKHWSEKHLSLHTVSITGYTLKYMHVWVYVRIYVCVCVWETQMLRWDSASQNWGCQHICAVVCRGYHAPLSCLFLWVHWTFVMCLGGMHYLCNPHQTPTGRYYTHFVDEELEAWKG